MRKIIAVLVVTGGVLFATETRVSTFGGVADFMKDDVLALTYPAQILNFPSLLVLEAGDEATLINGDAYLKGYFGLGENHSMGVWGTYLNIPVYTYPYRTIKGLMLSYAKYFGESFGFGLNMGFGMYNSTVEDTSGGGFKNKESASNFMLNPGLTFYLSETDFIDIGFKFNMHTFDVKAEFPPDTTKAKGTSDISFDARYWKGISEYTSMVVGLHFLTSDNSFESIMGGDKIETIDKLSTFLLNFGINTQPIDILNLILGLSLSSYSRDYGEEGKVSSLSLAGVVGIEAEIGRWLILRLAARKDIWASFSDKYYSDPYQEATESSQDLLPLVLGFAYKRGNFRIDGAASPDIFYNGPYFITGQQSTLFYSLSLIYSFASF